MIGLFGLAACGDLLSQNDAEEGELSFLSSALSVADTALNLREGLSPFSRAYPAELFSTISPLAMCTLGSGISASTCNGSKQKTFTYNDCLGRFTGASYSGVLSLAFSNANCSLTLGTNDTVAVTSTNFSSRSPDGSVLNWSSASTSAYSGSSYGGGFSLNGIDADDLILNIAGVTRSKTTEAGREIYEHLVHSSTDISVGTGFETGDRRLNGTLTVVSNSSEFTASIQLVALEWSSNTCCYPQSGTANINYGGSRSGGKTYTFENTCAKIKDTDTEELLTLEACL